MAGPVDEALAARTPIGSALAAGTEAISIEQTITFTQYTRTVLPLDKYVFWVKTSPAVTVTAPGSFHYSSDMQQTEAENFSINAVVFTSEVPINDLDAQAPGTLFMATFDEIQFAFSSRGMFYEQTQMYHYRGVAVYPDMAQQVVDSGTDLHVDRVIVSNSLPLWLALNGYTPPNPGLGFANPVTLYPSFLVPANIEPPWASVEIPDESTTGLMAAPLISSDSSHQQLVTERVRITLFGLRNDDALTFLDCVIQYSLNYNTFGIMNIPVVRDAKRTQTELLTLAEKKVIDFEIDYYQFTARSVAQQLILTVQQTFLPQSL